MRHQSRTLLDGPDRAGARSFFKAIGFTDEDLAKPLIGVAHCWIEVTPCNFNHRRLAEKVKEGVRAAGGTPLEFNSISVTDGIAMGTEGMKSSLVSREVIADSIELVCRGHLFDGLVAITGCDKTSPAAAMALTRLNIPSLILYSGSIMPGEYNGRKLTVQDAYEAIGAYNAGRIDREELRGIENYACPGAGACGGQFTANTMSTAFEMLGISPMGFNGIPAVDLKKEEAALECGRLVMQLLEQGLRPRDVLNRQAILNAITGAMATAGSTNVVLHLLAIARESDIPLDIDDFDLISRKTPVLADLKPAGRFTAPDMHQAGGMTYVGRLLLEAGLVDGDLPTVTGRTLAQELGRGRAPEGQEVIRPLSNPIKKTGGLIILRGNLAPEGCVLKISGVDRDGHTGPARVFDREEPAFAAIKQGRIKAGDVIVIRNEGPVGGPGMRELLAVTGAVQGSGLGDKVALIRDGRFRGGARGSRSGCRRTPCRLAGWRHHHAGHRGTRDERGLERRGDPEPPPELEAPRGADQDRRPGQVRPYGLLTLGRRRYLSARLNPSVASRSAQASRISPRTPGRSTSSTVRILTWRILTPVPSSSFSGSVRLVPR